MSDDNPLPEFNDLVREAMSAQEMFDNWDQGKTFYSGAFGGRRYCTIDEVTSEWSAANAKLIEYTLKHGQRLLSMERADDEA
jgi:hypothetical protein